MANVARPTKIWDQTLNDWVFLAGVVDTTKSYTYTADQTFPGITATSYNGGPIVGRNFILNGGFDIWQRGTSVTSSSGFLNTTFLADRWSAYYYGGGNTANYTMSRQDQVPAAIPGYESQYFIRHAFPAGNATTYWEWNHRIEDVRTLAGQTVTFSYWAKNTGTVNPTIEIQQNFGSGGSTTNYAYLGSPTIGNTWQRYSWTTTLGSIAGKTIGAGSYLQFKLYFGPTAGTVTAFNLDIDNVQLEIGPVATQFTRQNISYQAELAACHRYYWQTTSSPNGAVTLMTGGLASGTANVAQSYCAFPSPMRTIPTASINSTNLQFWDATGGGAGYSVGAILAQNSSIYQGTLNIASSGLTNNNRYNLLALTGSTGFLAFSAEL